MTYIHAFYVFCATMCAALVVTLVLLRSALPHLCPRWSAWVTMALIVSMFQPVLRTTVGGQNTALSIFLLAALYAALRAQKPALAGGILGLLTYKPQLVPLPAFVLVVQREWRALAAAAAVGLAHYLVAATWCGLDWPLKMVRVAGTYGQLEWASNLPTHFSLIPVFNFALPRPLNHVAAILSICGVLGVVLWIARHYRAAGPGSGGLWALVFTGAMLVSPHLQYYDVGLLVVPAVLGLEHLMERAGRPPLALRMALAAGYVGYPLYSLSRTLRFQPLVLWLVAMFVWLVRLLRRETAS